MYMNQAICCSAPYLPDQDPGTYSTLLPTKNATYLEVCALQKDIDMPFYGLLRKLYYIVSSHEAAEEIAER